MQMLQPEQKVVTVTFGSGQRRHGRARGVGCGRISRVVASLRLVSSHLSSAVDAHLLRILSGLGAMIIKSNITNIPQAGTNLKI